jgi:NADPH-dependent glutamate synthase beta subunit-like oxidoreductase/NAD-dependent dihydropyrimidine dehydrogenase PreA subunit
VFDSHKTGGDNLSADIVVIGGGGAGLAAAVTAAEKGADVVVLEKRNCSGGNTAMASGLFAAESPVQKRSMVDASRDELFKAMIDWAHWTIDPRIIRAYINRSGDTIRWLEEKGCSFELMAFFPNQTPVVIHKPQRKAAVTDALRKSCDDLGVRFLLRTEARKIVTGTKGAVTGVIASDRRGEFSITANKVLIATGGYGGNKELIRQYYPHYHDNMHCLGLPNMGDGLRMGVEAGAATEGLGMLQIEGPCVPRSVRLAIDAGDGGKTEIMLTQVAIEPYTIWVNRDGMRFVDETFGHSPFVVSNAIIRQPDGMCYSLLDSAMIEKMSREGLFIARGPAGKILGSGLPGLKEELQTQAREATLSYSRIDPELCNGCGVCENVCPLDIIRLDTVVDDKAEASPCRSGCPAGVDMRRYFYLLRQGMLKEAARVITEANPFPAITGRVCPHPCESECARNDVDEAVNINSVERFLGDLELTEETTPAPKALRTKTAIIGSGPAGLSCAYFLAKLGYSVTVFEALPVLGGMLRMGIPEYRLPKGVLDGQIERVRKLGVEFKPGIAVGKDIAFEHLEEDYDTLFIAAGNGLSRKIALDGAEHVDVLWGLDFLRDVNLRRKTKIGKKVVVIGGGNVAVDVALTAMRLGAGEVSMACLESGGAIPAHKEEIAQALAEGVTIAEGWGPLRIMGNDGAVTGIELARCVSLCDETGRFSPCLDEQDRKTVEADMIILAIGQAPDLSLIPDKIGVTAGGAIEVDSITGETSLPGIFAGGDITTGASTVVAAIAAGRRAAVSIDRYHRKEDLKEGREATPNRVSNPPKERIPLLPRRQTPLLSVDERRRNFREVATGFDEDMAYDESRQCMTCGSRAVINTVEECRLCQACERNCPQKAASIGPVKTGEPYVKIADSWEEIARWIGTDAIDLKNTIQEYNNSCKTGHDSIFVKDHRYLIPLDTPPYYAIRCNVDYLDTIGGIKINERMEVLDKDNRVIPGLYAAGIDTGGWIGDTYCIRTTGTTFAFAINSGRIAGENAVNKAET